MTGFTKMRLCLRSSRFRSRSLKFGACPTWLLLSCLSLGCLHGFWASPVRAETAVDLVGGFDQQRLQKAFPLKDQQAIQEAAKLLYRVGKVNSDSFASRAGESFTGEEPIGEAVKLSGELVEVKVFRVSDSLVDLLGLRSISLAVLSLPSGHHVSVVASDIPADAKPGDRFDVTGMVINESAIVSAKASWFPKQSSVPGWQWLSNQGVDLGELPSLATRDRQPLKASDANAFYSIMAAASHIDADSADFVPPPALPVDPIDLLSNPKTLIGRYITLPVEVIQVTRVALTDPRRRQQLGSDHYFQVDAVGDLGNVVVKIEPHKSVDADADSNIDEAETPLGPATFENRYPVSMVMRDLPPFLEAAIREHEGGSAVISDVNMMVQANGFFFRLWSYQTKYMEQFGDDKQFGPLIIAASLQNLENDSPDPLGVGVIGWIAAILAIWLWQHLTSADDEAIRKRRRDKSSRPVDLESLT